MRRFVVVDSDFLDEALTPVKGEMLDLSVVVDPYRETVDVESCHVIVDEDPCRGIVDEWVRKMVLGTVV